MRLRIGILVCIGILLGASAVWWMNRAPISTPAPNDDEITSVSTTAPTESEKSLLTSITGIVASVGERSITVSPVLNPDLRQQIEITTETRIVSQRAVKASSGTPPVEEVISLRDITPGSRVFVQANGNIGDPATRAIAVLITL